MALKQWRIKAPYKISGQRRVLRFGVEAKTRESAKLIALKVIEKKSPVPIDTKEIKMKRA